MESNVGHPKENGSLNLSLCGLEKKPSLDDKTLFLAIWKNLLDITF